MKVLLSIIGLFFLIACSNPEKAVEQTPYSTGIASRYTNLLHDSLTANGEYYNRYLNTAAHRELPFNTLLRVVNTSNDSSVVVRVNDRGPFNYEREIDISYKAAIELDMIEDGITEVEIYVIGPWWRAVHDSL